ncbi:hypothetical protein DXU03_18550 [Rhizobium johnstonii]
MKVQWQVMWNAWETWDQFLNHKNKVEMYENWQVEPKPVRPSLANVILLGFPTLVGFVALPVVGVVTLRAFGIVV